VTPYRTSAGPPPPPQEPESGPDDDPVILWLALAVSLLGLVPRILAGGAWGAEPTIALLVAGTSSTLLVRRVWRTRRARRRHP
jgi:hypothetical protein